ncbi:MAG: D-3-phosphoglycerate dehydrogenase [Lysobacteraceae bacterium]|nr:MAG: D-3-phosphoglycerate dehydrogenase [Xanthomonadaceae bacterium]
MNFSLAKDKIGIVLAENISEVAVQALRSDGYNEVRTHRTALTGDDLHQALEDAHFIGIRSRTQLTREVLENAPKLAAIGCFCIGTNQVDIEAARELGIPVFNAPFSNTRSVAELVLAEIIMMFRGIPRRNAMAHRGEWDKNAKASREVRGKTLGVIGYGHIGTQLGIMGESMGMRVLFHDIENKLPLGNAQTVESLDQLLTESDVVSLHVPETPATHELIKSEHLAKMPAGAFLVNASRGTVVDIDALADALESGHIGGAAVDVFPTEPKSNDERFESPLQRFDNVILTPHIGGSTEEAQVNIAREVSSKLIKYSNNGSTESAVNFPQVSLPDHAGATRILHIHHNQPGVLERINRIFSDRGANIAAQYLQTDPAIGYVVMDIESSDAGLLDALKQVPGTIRARVLY